MGCDIHGWVEIKHKDKWVAFREFSREARDRNYDRFCQLASVRGCSNMKPQGIPKDASETVKYWIDHWDTDGHSHSYLPLSVAAYIFLSTEFGPASDYMNKYPESYYFGVDIDSSEKHCINDFRVVFWFDN